MVFFPCIISIYVIFNFYRFQISTLATKLGVKNISLLGSGLLLLNYIGSVAAAVYFPEVIVTLFKNLVSVYLQ